jgi:hypothetical protein
LAENEESWKDFESLVAQIHRTLDPGGQFEIVQNVKLAEAHGAKSQVDVLLRSKNKLQGNLLISCKSSKHPVGIDHVREWSDVVQRHGASAGVIVSPTGFTADAQRAATDPQRRISLWMPRRLNLDDFGPDESSPEGYIARVEVQGIITEWRPRTETIQLKLEKVGDLEGRELRWNFSRHVRDSWYLRDAADNVVGNLWDLFVESELVVKEAGPFLIEPPEPRYVVLEGVRLRFRSLSFVFDRIEHIRNISVDLLEESLAYENVVTGEHSIIPLPPSVLRTWV